VRVVPIGILFSDGTEEQDDTVAPERVGRAMMAQQAVKSLPPSVLDYLNAVEGWSEPIDHVVILTPAAEFTVMHRMATQAAALARVPVTVIDTRTAAAAQGLVVEAAAERAAAGAGGEEVADAARQAAGAVRLVAALASLETLRGGGLLPPPSLAGTGPAGSRRLFSFAEGRVEPVGEADEAEVVAALEARWTEGGGDPAVPASIFHAGDEVTAASLRSRLGVKAPLSRFSAAMTLHTGPGVVGVSWVPAG